MLTEISKEEKKKNYDKKKDSVEKELKKFKKEIKELKKELIEKNDKLLRSYADIQNFQKRSEKALQIKEDETKIKYVYELVELSELLKQAYKDNDPKIGIKLIIDNLEKFFEKEQIKFIDCVGKQFDHNLHHAVTVIDKKDCQDGIILKEVKRGYFIKNKLMRPSQVIVSKKNK